MNGEVVALSDSLQALDLGALAGGISSCACEMTSGATNRDGALAVHEAVVVAADALASD